MHARHKTKNDTISEQDKIKLENEELENAIIRRDNLNKEIEIDLDENLFQKAQMDQVAKDRVREIQKWSKSH